ncbi:head GIN domain-containing protein [Thermophagus xiamenensis]|uniref:Putative auto-transporter adhesin, head GIN domain n=1 Tax=Thermophagus xiamenensis TaxID=385682 RepID=A0A1I1Y9T6_9BACT|nr:head GIN domain-containing protein [Thermophagus xiamenensis]SFE16347.1 Putative auto-transporter adhesin, head GIN domain [Thermophagus xiamenensis]
MFRKIHFFVLLICPFSFCGCVFEGQTSDSAKSVVSEVRNIDNFNSLELTGNYVVTLENSDSYRIEISADEGIKKMVITEVINNVLKVNTLIAGTGKRYPSVELRIYVPDLQRIKVVSSAKFKSVQPFIFEDLYIESSGALKMNMELKGKRLEGIFAGATNLNLKGSVDQVVLDIPGAGKIAAFGLSTKNLSLKLSGASFAEVFVSEKLSVDISGACTVSYKGNPSEVFSNISGLGRIRNAN